MTPLTIDDLRDLHEWSKSVVADANGWAERAEVSRGERKALTTKLDSIASQAREVASLTTVLMNRCHDVEAPA